MIAYLEGRILAQALDSDACVLLTSGGVGYMVYLSKSVARGLPANGETSAFHVATVVREDAIDLYGFATAYEREIFLVCLGIANLGPKTALALLSTYGPDDLRWVMAADDPTLLTRVPGIGKKKAQQIFLELKYKLKISNDLLTLPFQPRTYLTSSFRDAMAGLINLGYAEDEVRAVLERVFAVESDLDVVAALRQALKIMAKG
ncbi:Holliday junction ATP-dependent DNA helicase RuvA [Desulfovibrionales bacterium]